jgi:hypothetical protein
METTTSSNTEFQLGVLKRFIKQKAGDDFLLSEALVKDFAKCLKVFVHYLSATYKITRIFMYRADDICKERRKNIMTENEVKEALKEMGLEFLMENINMPVSLFCFL